jgi:hypothetical protein
MLGDEVSDQRHVAATAVVTHHGHANPSGTRTGDTPARRPQGECWVIHPPDDDDEEHPGCGGPPDDEHELLDGGGGGGGGWYW